jgi:hypothetical protein
MDEKLRTAIDSKGSMISGAEVSLAGSLSVRMTF